MKHPASASFPLLLSEPEWSVFFSTLRTQVFRTPFRFAPLVTENETNSNYTVRNDRLRLFCQAKFVPLPNFNPNFYTSLKISLTCSGWGLPHPRCRPFETSHSCDLYVIFLSPFTMKTCQMKIQKSIKEF